MPRHMFMAPCESWCKRVFVTVPTFRYQLISFVQELSSFIFEDIKFLTEA